ncbi:hypothetical protein LNKW23_44260 [Paralimibaculum aggregatum]|uniref:Uncharacterized protein n=1 Tax=Paralimibaculum aggregatum TaxID=3036245 RepID=A0ABQ6LT03_9RHOB|nr:hypothetical protein [Limibaculum sp. NKW23]GMG85210.1 hypothetical protein LNKW23_44260 [Limibaculum sp. NKW23]
MHDTSDGAFCDSARSRTATHLGQSAADRLTAAENQTASTDLPANDAAEDRSVARVDRGLVQTVTAGEGALGTLIARQEHRARRRRRRGWQRRHHDPDRRRRPRRRRHAACRTRISASASAPR